MKIGVPVSLGFMVFSGHVASSGIAGSYDKFYSWLVKEPPYCSPVDVPIYIPNNSVGGFPFLHTLSSISCRFFDNGHLDPCEVIPPCSFNLHSSVSFHFVHDFLCCARAFEFN